MEIRSLKLGGYQLISNTILRARIKNYFPLIRYDPSDRGLKKDRIKLMFAQSGSNKLILVEKIMKEKEFSNFYKMLQKFPEINELSLSKNECMLGNI